MTPPGTGRGEGHNGRGGLVLFQDPDTYVIVNVWLDDAPDHDGIAISMFFRSRRLRAALRLAVDQRRPPGHLGPAGHAAGRQRRPARS